MKQLLFILVYLSIFLPNSFAINDVEGIVKEMDIALKEKNYEKSVKLLDNLSAICKLQQDWQNYFEKKIQLAKGLRKIKQNENSIVLFDEIIQDATIKLGRFNEIVALAYHQKALSLTKFNQHKIAIENYRIAIRIRRELNDYPTYNI